MSDFQPQPASPRQTDRWLEPGATNVQVIYILYLASFVLGITALVGLVLAYINRGKAGGWVDTHYTYAIRTFWLSLLYILIATVLVFLLIGTFWIALLYGFVSVILMLVLVGVLLAFATAVWVIVRCVIGLQTIGRGEPIKNPTSWWI
jgi:uncharacterized membrane protein